MARPTGQACFVARRGSWSDYRDWRFGTSFVLTRRAAGRSVTVSDAAGGSPALERGPPSPRVQKKRHCMIPFSAPVHADSALRAPKSHLLNPHAPPSHFTFSTHARSRLPTVPSGTEANSPAIHRWVHRTPTPKPRQGRKNFPVLNHILKTAHRGNGVVDCTRPLPSLPGLGGFWFV